MPIKKIKWIDGLYVWLNTDQIESIHGQLYIGEKHQVKTHITFLSGRSFDVDRLPNEVAEELGLEAFEDEDWAADDVQGTTMTD